jgi:hypothetical protein
MGHVQIDSVAARRAAGSAEPGDDSAPAAIRAEGIDLRLLEVFVAVAEELHFGRAARRLGVAQPPVSRSIQTLESRFGLSLLRRSSRSVELTRAGAILLRSSSELLAQHRKLLDEMTVLHLEAVAEPMPGVAFDPGIAVDEHGLAVDEHGLAPAAAGRGIILASRVDRFGPQSAASPAP